MDLGQRLHDETRVEVVDEITGSVGSVTPRAISILRF
jgi:hypothetical protein